LAPSLSTAHQAVSKVEVVEEDVEEGEEVEER